MKLNHIQIQGFNAHFPIVHQIFGFNIIEMQFVIYFPDITYGFYRTYAKTYGLDMEEIPVKDDFSIDINDYMELKGDIVFANPNNPTGLTIPVDDIERLVKANLERMVIIDEAYAMNTLGSTMMPISMLITLPFFMYLCRSWLC